MEPFPKELNKSKFNPEEADATREAAEKEKEAKQEQEKEAKGGKGGAKTQEKGGAAKGEKKKQ